MINEIIEINSLDNISDYISTILEFKKKELAFKCSLLIWPSKNNNYYQTNFNIDKANNYNIIRSAEEDTNIIDQLFDYREKLNKIALNYDLVEYLMEKLSLKGNSVYLIFQLAKEILNKNYPIINSNLYFNNKEYIDLHSYYKSALAILENDIKQLSDLLFELTKTLIEV